METIRSVLERHPPIVKTAESITTVAAFSVAKQQFNPKKPTTKKVLSRVKLHQHIAAAITFFTAAVVVLTLHVRSDHPISNANASIAQMCLQTVRPWFAQNVSCSVILYSCYRQGVTSPSSDSLDNLQREMLSSIIFEHCPAFEMPLSIRDFPNLLGLELWNVTIVHWGREAALSGAIHRKMIFLVMVFVNMTALPEGILTPPVPEVLVDIEIIASNLTRIPDEVADAWKNAQVVYLEHTLLDEFPTVLFRLPVDETSLVNNSLKDIPDDLFTLNVYWNQFSTLALSYNPLQKLPDSAASSLFVGELLMAHTQVDTLPVWVETSVKDLVLLGNSPFCEEEDAAVLETVDRTESERKPLDSGLYPLAFVELSRQI